MAKYNMTNGGSTFNGTIDSNIGRGGLVTNDDLTSDEIIQDVKDFRQSQNAQFGDEAVKNRARKSIDEATKRGKSSPNEVKKMAGLLDDDDTEALFPEAYNYTYTHKNTGMTKKIDVPDYKHESTVVISLDKTHNIYDMLKSLVSDESNIKFNIITDIGVRGTDTTGIYEKIMKNAENAFKTSNWSTFEAQLKRIYNIRGRTHSSENASTIGVIRDKNGDYVKLLGDGANYFDAGNNSVNRWGMDKNLVYDENGKPDVAATLDAEAFRNADAASGDVWQQIRDASDDFKDAFDFKFEQGTITEDKMDTYTMHLREVLVDYLQKLMFNPAVISGKRFSIGSVKAIENDINELLRCGDNVDTIRKLAHKYRDKLNDVTSQRDANTKNRKQSADQFMAEVKELDSLIKDMTDNDKLLQKYGGQDQLEAYKNSYANIKSFIDKISKVTSTGKLTIPGGLSLEYDKDENGNRTAHVVQNATNINKVHLTGGIDQIYKILEENNRLENWRKRNNALTKQANDLQKGEMYDNAQTTDAEKRKNKDIIINGPELNADDLRAGTIYSSDFTKIVNDKLDRGKSESNNTAKTEFNNTSEPDISASEKSKVHKENVAADQAAGKKEEGLTQEEKAAKRKRFIKAKKAAVNSGKKPTRVVQHKKEKKNEEKD